MAGVPDVFFADGKPGLFIEMKEPGKGRLQDAQKKVIALLNSNGYQVAVCYGYEEAKSALVNYFNNKGK